ncbi:flagellar basal body rod protein FlgB [Bacillus sp. FJAT-27251]|uniref:flagellar basal body rod protein FlgB n=1 Tax=Bacillus sp. FJAT-27251 TaxID=1684142 RepID=UPI0006A7B4F0|nr:flagellar basal body rod protein FlgB [Bacillus sp. FJAT-27251]
MNLFPQSFQVLERSLSASALKQKVIASNIANVDTPDYKSKKVDFQEVLNGAISQRAIPSYKTNSRHLPFSSEGSSFNPAIKTNHGTKFKSNGNNVDMDYEMAELAKNQLWYNALTDRVNGHFNNLRSVINEGR